MKLSLFTNDKSTVKDELILSVITILFLAIGITLIVVKPSLGIVKSHNMVVLGMLLTLAGVMYIPGLIYRFMTNDKK